ncbi:tail fiber protein [Clostridiales bacterium PH28_bin88]|nr:tail fiber protein [Clostridiales bacterium PH28_bin88]
MPGPAGLKSAVVGAVFLAIAVSAALTSWYTVAEHEQGMVMTFGRVTNYTEPGLHFKIPWPVQSVEVLPVKKTFALKFGYREKDGVTVDVPEEAMMLTGDENIVWADAQVEWRVADAKKFLYGSADPEKVLVNATSASIRSVMGTTDLDLAITTGKVEIQAKIQENLMKLMDNYDVGVQILAVKLQDVEPPDAVKAAFQAVTDAREMKNTKINQAEKYRNEQVPNARGEANALIANAEATKKERVAHAQGDVAKFNALYIEYARSKDITTKRLIIETLEQVLPGAEIYIMDQGDGGTVKYLPLREVKGGKE